jgi:hypothetical protein
MTTIFGDFYPLFGEKIGVSLENQSDVNFFLKTKSILSQKADFLSTFSAKILLKC